MKESTFSFLIRVIRCTCSKNIKTNTCFSISPFASGLFYNNFANVVRVIFVCTFISIFHLFYPGLKCINYRWTSLSTLWSNCKFSCKMEAPINWLEQNSPTYNLVETLVSFFIFCCCRNILDNSLHLNRRVFEFVQPTQNASFIL